MGLGLAMGYGAEGAQVGLERLLAQREAAKKMALYEQAQQQNEAFRQKQLASQEALKQQALEEAARRNAEMGAYQQENLRTREAIAKMYEEGRGARAQDQRDLQERLGLLRDETTRASWEARMAQIQAQQSGADNRALLALTRPRPVTIKGPNGEAITVMRRYDPETQTFTDVSSDERPAGEAAQTVASRMDDLDRLIGEIKGDYKPDMTGMVQGRAGQWLRDKGSAPFWLSEEDKAKFDRLATNVARLKNEMLQARSGVAVPLHEEIRTDREVPQLSNRDNTFLTKLDQTQKNIIEFRNRVRRLPQGGQPPAPAAGGMGSPTAPAASQGSGPAPGEERMINGRRGRWNGQAWVAVK